MYGIGKGSSGVLGNGSSNSVISSPVMWSFNPNPNVPFLRIIRPMTHIYYKKED
jgi:hypothetical protein